MFFIIGLFILLSMSSFLGWLYLVVPYRMAHKRHRKAFGWVMLSLLATPIVAIAALLWVGESTDGRALADPFV